MTLHYLRGIIRIALFSLLQHRLRSLLSIVGIVCGVAAVFAILSIGEGAKREVLDSMRSLGLDNIILRRIHVPHGRKHPGTTESEGIQFADIPILRSSSPAILDIAYLKEIQAQMVGVPAKVTPQVVACSWSYMVLQGLNLSSGRFLLPEDEQQRNAVCVLGATLARRLGEQGKIGSYLRLANQLFLVVGIVRGNAPLRNKKPGMVLAREINAMLFLPFGSHRYLPQNAAVPGEDLLDEIILKTSGPQAAMNILPLISRTMDLRHNNTRNYQMIVPRQIIAQAGKTQRIFNLVLGCIGGISLVVGGIGIMNVLLATVSERTREIGIRRAVGARREDIVAQFLAESIILTITGGMAGIAVGFLCSWAVAGFAQWSVATTITGILLPMLTSVLVGLCAGLFPAIKASRMDPVRALRSS